MSARDAYITIHNNTGYTLTNLKTPDPTDGVFTSKPASSISHGSSSKFEVSKSSDASDHGPEGYLTYQFVSQGVTYTVQVNWNFPNNNATGATYWISGDSRVQSPSSTVNHDVGDHTQNIDAYVEFNASPMNNWDVVLAMTQTTLNNQILYLFQNGYLNKAISETTSSGTLQIDTLNAPSVQITQTANTVTLTLPVRKGSVTPSGSSSTDLGGYTLTVTAKVSALTLSSAGQVLMPEEAAAQVAQYQGVGLSVLALFIDLQQASPTGLSITKGSTAITDSSVLHTVAAGLAAWGASSADSRWALSLLGSSPHPTPAQSPLPGLIPTSSSFSTTWYSANPALSTLNILMMLNGNVASAKNLTSFSPLITDTNVWIFQKIDNSAFGKNYIEAAVLPTLQQDLGATSVKWGQYSSTYWNISYTKDNSAHNSGKGDKTVEDNEADYYTLNSALINCDVNLLGTSLALKVYVWSNLESKTTKYPLFGASWLPILVNDTTDTASETVVFDFSTNAQGQLVLALRAGYPTKSKGQPTSKTGSVQSVINWTKDKLGIDNNFADVSKIQQNLVNSLNNDKVHTAVSAVGALDSVLVLPAGNVYTYSHIQLDSNSNITLSLTPRT
ncbi:hypothetical protein [Hyalangium rubrum]|uniref:Uncharacterized protein n=1 Tax=Hyalangium rubrum TaxID=3103134 RepID=A0ABU5HGW8_9BACT|nr:hypothetical protein [Hyalangium sp. s54d21]MDY7232402.1 hypothetical protein [Hyalangium sp. s54d21]